MNFCEECKLCNTARCPGKERCKVEESINNIKSNILMPLPDCNKLIPEKIDLEAFNRLKNIKENVVKFVSDGTFLLLYSDYCGNGKTTWCRKICTAYVNAIYDILVKDYKEFCLSDELLNNAESKKAFLWSKDRIDKCAMLVNVSALLAEKKKAIAKNDNSIDDYIDKMLETSLLVLDDIGFAASSGYDTTLLYSIINRRMAENKSTIITTNSIKDLRANIDARIYDRITAEVMIELQGKSRRSKSTEW